METLTSIRDDEGLASQEPVPSPRIEVHGRIARQVAILGVSGVVAAFVIAASMSGVLREARRKQCEAHLKRLGLAFHEYHEAHGHFPAPALARSDGTPLLSWRVALLPHLGYRSLYERFHLDEPWDSPHNRSLLAEMPAELACPGAAGSSDFQTGYLVIVGPEIDPYAVNTPFDSRRGVDFREITDGTSNTILVMETDTLVPWTKPDDLHWSPTAPLPRLSSPHKGGAHALFADGSTTRTIKPTIAPNILRALFTINGGEVLGGG